MNENELRRRLGSLGLDESNWRAVLLLPLVQVAWADREIQRAERREIERIAQLLGVDPVLRDRWLEKRPTDAQLAEGLALIGELVHRQRGLGSDLTPELLDTLHDLCVSVAGAAGGLFGVAFTVSPEEKQAIASVSVGLKRASTAFMEQLPTPSSGRFEDL